ncbi:hypothetical protein [Flavobacterium undicola]|uniref:hypothetical protein n=1 Tax=Flavobacterium undicola TaxID=1932779 RepID=UPI001377B983|nr:hypothetical protein [Flavobacterium undicola]MBA0885184.1 hypothetical protein [Flavobacterium undicola]
MRNIITFYLLIIHFFIYCQAKKNEDLIKGIVEHGAIVGDKFEGCKLNKLKFLLPDTSVYIYGYYSCFDNDQRDFYKVFYNNAPCFISSKELIVAESDQNKLKSLDSVSEANLERITFQKSKSVLSNQLTKEKSFLAKGKQKGILIQYVKPFDESEYSEGTGIKIAFRNMSKKPMKYVWFNLKGLNRVNDLVSSKTVKIIGVINPGEIGKVEFNYVWYTDIIEKCKTPSIKIQYIDGTFSTIQNADSLIVTEDIEYTLFPDN